MTMVRYREGDWFAVPLHEGGYAIGLLARASSTGVLLGYFFGPRRVVMPTLADAQGLSPDHADLVGKFGHLGLQKGTWPILGRFEEWSRDEWPMPVFVRYEELTGRSFEVTYEDSDPNSRVRVQQISPGTAEQRPKDGMMGAGFVEKRLSRLLS